MHRTIPKPTPEVLIPIHFYRLICILVYTSFLQKVSHFVVQSFIGYTCVSFSVVCSVNFFI